jgi:methionyl-tRNA synthetase
MYTHEFHLAMNVVDNFIRGINKHLDKNVREAQERNDEPLRKQILVDVFHMVRTAAVLMHPIAPVGTEMIREYLNMDEELWSWDRIFDTLYSFMDDPATHRLKYLPARTDFFEKHPSQINRS